jgi:hypothetical protein
MAHDMRGGMADGAVVPADDARARPRDSARAATLIDPRCGANAVRPEAALVPDARRVVPVSA